MRRRLLCRQDLGQAKASIEELFGKIGEIRRKADQSERLVQVPPPPPLLYTRL